MQILIVDDNPTNLKLLTELVRKMQDCSPLPFSSPDAALAAMPDIDFDVAIIDYMMPVYNGVELVTEFVRFEKYVGKPVIFVTADLDVSTRIEALDAGAIDFMTKPINPVEFQMRVGNIVDLALAREQLKANPGSVSREAEEEIIRRLILAAGYKDPHAARRQGRIAAFSHAIALAAGIEADIAEDIRLVAPVIGAGKVAVPDADLLRRGKITESAFKAKRRKSAVDAAPVAGGSLLRLASEVAAAHRERWDGQGMPLRLKGKAIPMPARIVAVADAFDSLTQERPFKAAMTIEDAARHISRRSGQHYDPVVVDAFVAALTELAAILRADRLSPVMAEAG